LVAMQPKEATLIVNDQEIKTNVERIVVNDVLLIRPGEKIPADGVVVKGLSSVDESMVNGSSKPEIKEEGHKVYEGSINGSGVLYVRATATGKDTLLAGQMHMVDQAHSSALQVQRTVDAVSSKFVPLVTVLSGLTFFGWLNRGESAAHALSNAIAVLLISCPCALGLATPAATMVGTGQAARRGIYIRNGKALETAVRIDTVVFDKTGTLTEGNAQVTDFLNISALDDESVIQLASSAEFNSEHFLAQALVRYGKLHGLSLLKSSRFYSLPDQGIRSTVGDHRLLLGTDSWLEAQNIDLTAVTATSKKWAAQGKTLVFMAIDQKAAALFAVTDTVKASAVSAIKNLHEKAIKSIMVTGDSEQAALPVARQLGITTVIANASPGKKLEIIRELQKQGHWIAMVGDGINDAPSLAAANLGMAVDKGTDIAIHAADLILVNSDINKVAETIAIGEKTLVTIKQNLLWAFSYNAVAIPFAVFGRLSPTMASAAMALSSVSVLINSLSLTKRIDGR
jgi:Cu+-exporting ATPase